MGKPRLIILIRHAQSEGNKNRDIHQFIPDHRVKLTQDGWVQAEEAGRRLRSMLKPDDTIQFFTSPYRRTRETTEGILRTLTSDDPEPSPFPRHKINVFEEPRLREQDFGNFQPCSAEMERMWQERADYGHFFYRIPNGESAADAYDRIAGFNESLWRQFGDEDFPSVCVLVTHGLMTRVFLMKWYHWSVEYFEDLRNVNHCEFIVMNQNPTNGKYILENQLRTWSDLKRRAAALNTNVNSGPPQPYTASPSTNTPVRRWGGCANGCNHDKINYPRKIRRRDTAEYAQVAALAEKANGSNSPVPSAEQKANNSSSSTLNGKAALKHPIITDLSTTEVESPLNTGSTDAENGDASSSSTSDHEGANRPRPRNARSSALPIRLHPGRDFGGSRSGAETSAEGFFSDDSDFFPDPRTLTTNSQPSRSIATVFGNGKTQSRARSTSRGSRVKSVERHNSQKRTSQKTEAEWAAESGMCSGARAEPLGDGDAGESEIDSKGRHGTIDEANEDEDKPKGAVEKVVEEEKMKDRKSFSEVY